MATVSFRSDLHPYECGQNCVHCTNPQTGDHSLVDCAFCWGDLLDSLNIKDFNVHPSRQLRSHGEDDVMHGGQEFTVLAEGDAAIEDLGTLWVREAGHPAPTYTYRFKLTGAHGGPLIELLMVNPTDESDGYGGRDFVWERLIWADDLAPFDHDYFLDAYTDQLRDVLADIAKNCWD